MRAPVPLRNASLRMPCPAACSADLADPLGRRGASKCAAARRRPLAQYKTVAIVKSQLAGMSALSPAVAATQGDFHYGPMSGLAGCPTTAGDFTPCDPTVGVPSRAAIRARNWRKANRERWLATRRRYALAHAEQEKTASKQRRLLVRAQRLAQQWRDMLAIAPAPFQEVLRLSSA